MYSFLPFEADISRACALNLSKSLRAYPCKQTISEPLRISHWGQKQKLTVRTACYTPSVHAAGTSPSWHNPYKD